MFSYKMKKIQALSNIVYLKDKNFSYRYLITTFYISDKHQTHNVFILASTTGDGDAPFHAENFKQALENHRNLDAFKGLNFAVFALGSSMYENFCEFGKFCHKTIKSLGGRSFVDLGYGDDQTDQEKCFQEWAQIAVLNLCSINNVAASNGMKSRWPFVTKSSTKELYLHLSGNGGKYVIKFI